MNKGRALNELLKNSSPPVESLEPWLDGEFDFKFVEPSGRLLDAPRTKVIGFYRIHAYFKSPWHETPRLYAILDIRNQPLANAAFRSIPIKTPAFLAAAHNEKAGEPCWPLIQRIHICSNSERLLIVSKRLTGALIEFELRSQG